MRRTKSNKLHPSALTVASSLSQYDDPERDRVDYDGGGPEDSLWDGLPIFPVPESWCIVKKYKFHYPGDVDLTTLWSQIRDGIGATDPSIASGQGGGMTFQTGTSPALSYNYVYEQNGIFSFQPGNTTWIEWEIKIENRGRVTVGFGETYTFDPLAPPGIEPVVPRNGFNIDTAGRMWVYNDGVGQVYIEDVVITDATYDSFEKTGMRIEPSASDPSKFDIYVFFEGEHQGTYKEIDLPTENLGIYIGDYWHESTVTVRDIVVIQEKDE